MRRAFTLIEVTAALAVFAAMSGATVVIGQRVLAREAETQFLTQFKRDWERLRQRVRLTGFIGTMTIEEGVVTFADRPENGTTANQYRLPIPATLTLAKQGSGDWDTTRLVFTFTSKPAVTVGQVVFRRANGKLVRFAVLLQWGVMRRTNQ